MATRKAALPGVERGLNGAKGKPKRWFRDDYIDAVWETEALRPNEVLVALVYADHAGDPKKPDNDIAWVAWARLSQRTGIRSKTTLSRATKGLEAAGWFIEVEKRRQHRSPRYRLAIPEHPEVRATYVWEEDNGAPEVQDMDLSDSEGVKPEVQDMDNWDSPEVQNLTPEVHDTPPRGPENGPDLSTDHPSLNSARMADVTSTSTTRAREDETEPDEPPDDDEPDEPAYDEQCMDCGWSLGSLAHRIHCEQAS